MKKYVTILIAMLLLFSMSMTVFAETTTNTTTVSLTVEDTESYVLKIPSDITIDSTKKQAELKVELTDVSLVWSSDIWVYVDSANPVGSGNRGAFLVNPDSQDKKIRYQLTSGVGPIYNGSPMLLYAHNRGGNTNGLLTLQVDGEYPGSGTYTDTLTFTVEIRQ